MAHHKAEVSRAFGYVTAFKKLTVPQLSRVESAPKWGFTA